MAKSIVVTGATGDIGRETVSDALSRGYRVIATIRKEEQKQSFPDHPQLQFALMTMDSKQAVESGFASIDALLGEDPLDAVIHCAAIEVPSPVEVMDRDTLNRVFDTNTGGSLSILQAALPRLRKSKGNLVFASSLWGRVSGPMVGAYAASKWALEALTDSARRETRGMGVSLVLANIGAVQSRMLSEHSTALEARLASMAPNEQELYRHVFDAHITTLRKFEKSAITSEKVGKRLVDIAEAKKPRPRYKIGADSKALCFLNWLLPAKWLDGMLGHKYGGKG